MSPCRQLVPWVVWLFGSAARGDGSASSDVDVLAGRDDTVDEEDPTWPGPTQKRDR